MGIAIVVTQIAENLTVSTNRLSEYVSEISLTVADSETDSKGTDSADSTEWYLPEVEQDSLLFDVSANCDLGRQVTLRLHSYFIFE